MDLKIYDTLTKKIKKINIHSNEIFKFYCCGPTLYGGTHIGNFRTFLIQDILRRILIFHNINHLHVRNLTDIDDKIIISAKLKNMTIYEITEFYYKKFLSDCNELNIVIPHNEPRATNYIQEQINIIQTLIKKNHAYIKDDGSVYYKISTFKNYGKLSNRHLSKVKKKDFVLWKPYNENFDIISWDSPWGKGRPGWHIECSAMCNTIIGKTCNLHSGGIDLCFPHHENEIAQSESLNNCLFSEHWFHISHLKINGNKMSKSIGNIYNLEDIKLKKINPIVLRYFLISKSYRKPMDFKFDYLFDAEKALLKLNDFKININKKYNSLYGELNIQNFNNKVNWNYFKDSYNAICTDLNIAKALGLLFKKISIKNFFQESKNELLNQIYEFENILYLLGINVNVLNYNNNLIIPKNILELAKKRWLLKKENNFEKSDYIRELLMKNGWLVVDFKDKWELHKKK